ncbi:TnsA endonuclease N-terminal domain-containing protein [Chitinimonas sp.]|uniref:TnsA endonuclease N-terminal domain-containing protein n=1 Tax=Chitinimonas sp. TaxID=1934313 RepID=UPI0035B3A4DD
MRKGKRFNPAWIRKAIADGRGTGTRESYTPWHQIRRADPGSRGRSHLIQWKFARNHHLLSDQELVPFAFATMLPNVVDAREQFPLSRDEHRPEAAGYHVSLLNRVAPGTRSIASDLEIRHPIVRALGDKENWVLSTDLLLTLMSPAQLPTLLAISVKSSEDAKERRKRELLLIEKTYWEEQGGEWLLFVPSDHCQAIRRTIIQALPWAIAWPPQPEARLEESAALAPSLERLTLQGALTLIIDHLGVSLAEAQQVFWQSVWAGRIPLCLDRFNFHQDPIHLFDQPSFWAQNPIFSRRSSWTA